ncbi:hypothetical protein [Rhodococcus ruber]|uniref:hypothetical protein n=1 Tax=Rhodococcus ruber TaxID=1830 RepID=UPI00315D0F0D
MAFEKYASVPFENRGTVPVFPTLTTGDGVPRGRVPAGQTVHGPSHRHVMQDTRRYLVAFDQHTLIGQSGRCIILQHGWQQLVLDHYERPPHRAVMDPQYRPGQIFRVHRIRLFPSNSH